MSQGEGGGGRRERGEEGRMEGKREGVRGRGGGWKEKERRVERKKEED